MNEDALNPETNKFSVPLSLLGEVLAALRKEQGITPQELSARLNLPQAAVARMEREKCRTVNLERLVQVAEAQSPHQS